jgi:hypothetical protein
MDAADGPAPPINPSTLLPQIIRYCLFEGQATDLALDPQLMNAGWRASNRAPDGVFVNQVVDFIDGSAFSHISHISHILISIEAGNSHFIVDSSCSKLIRYFGCGHDVMIPFNIEILCSSCFSNCESLSSISFENDSQLKRIESYTFSGFPLEATTIH